MAYNSSIEGNYQILRYQVRVIDPKWCDGPRNPVSVTLQPSSLTGTLHP